MFWLEFWRDQREFVAGRGEANEVGAVLHLLQERDGQTWRTLQQYEDCDEFPYHQNISGHQTILNLKI